MKMTVDIPEDLHKKLSIIASVRGDSIKDVVIEAIENELDNDRDRKNIEKLWGKRK